jgi:putative NIF3 family GTP cyclohydrolase 1 type 2
MKATSLYQRLERDFITPEMTDEWAQHMESVADFLSQNFKRRSMGLVCDHATEIGRVYTAVFPSRDVMGRILDDGARDAMLFVHHPSIWDIRRAPEVFQQMDKEQLQTFKERRISIYNLHVPLDAFGDYSTSVSLARALEIITERPFAPYCGTLCGVFGKTALATVKDLRNRFRAAVGHEVSLYNYGNDEIRARTVAITTGGGNDVAILKDVAEAGVNTYVTGITAKNDYSRKAHAFAKEHGINVLGGSHYSTEKFACMSMVGYFERIGLPSKFLEDEPVMEDM